MKQILILILAFQVNNCYCQNLLGGGSNSKSDNTSSNTNISNSSSNKAISPTCYYTPFTGTQYCNSDQVLVANSICCPSSSPFYCPNTNQCYSTCSDANNDCNGSVIKGSHTEAKPNIQTNNNTQYKCETECLTQRVWTFQGGAPVAYFKFNSDYSFEFQGSSGNSSGGIWVMLSSTGIYLNYKTTTYSSMPQNQTIEMLGCNTLRIDNKTWQRPYDKYGPFYGDDRCK
jgi:hypothetical protein